MSYEALIKKWQEKPLNDIAWEKTKPAIFFSVIKK
jgi:hypothetical protein